MNGSWAAVVAALGGSLVTGMLLLYSQGRANKAQAKTEWRNKQCLAYEAIHAACGELQRGRRRVRSLLDKNERVATAHEVIDDFNAAVRPALLVSDDDVREMVALLAVAFNEGARTGGWEGFADQLSNVHKLLPRKVRRLHGEDMH